MSRNDEENKSFIEPSSTQIPRIASTDGRLKAPGSDEPVPLNQDNTVRSSGQPAPHSSRASSLRRLPRSSGPSRSVKSVNISSKNGRSGMAPDEKEREVLQEAEHDMDFLLQNLGYPGRYQVLLFGALISCMLPVIWSDLCTIFYGISPSKIICDTASPAERLPESSSVFQQRTIAISSFNESSAYTKVYATSEEDCPAFSHQINNCSGTVRYIFEEAREWSIIAEWDLLCDDLWLDKFATTIYFLGVVLGSVVFGNLADRFGRRRCIISCYIGYLPLSIGIAFVHSYRLFAALRFLIGFFVQGLQNVCFVLLMEYSAPRYREVIGGLEGVVANFGIMALSGMAFWWGHWRKIQLCFTIPTFIALSKIGFVKESLRWLMVHGNLAKATECVRKILRWNGMEANPHLDDVLDKISSVLQAEESLEKGYTWLDCFRTPNMRKFVVLQCFMWFSALFVYYGISFSITDFGGNIYLNTFATALAEIPAAFIAMYAMKRYGRKLPLIIYFVLCGLFCFVGALLSFGVSDAVSVDIDLIRRILVFVARFFLAGTFGVLFVYGSELFPTVLRNTAFGICLAFHTSGGVVAPQVLLLGDYTHPSVPFFIFSACTMISAGLVLFLPETWNIKMPDTLEEVESTAFRPAILMKMQSFNDELTLA